MPADKGKPLALTGGEASKKRSKTKYQTTMANRPLAYTLTEGKTTIETMAENSTSGSSCRTQVCLGHKL